MISRAYVALRVTRTAALLLATGGLALVYPLPRSLAVEPMGPESDPPSLLQPQGLRMIPVPIQWLSRSKEKLMDQLDDEMERARSDFWAKQLKTNFGLTGGTLPITFGIHTGGRRLSDTAVFEDAEKLATDQQLGGKALWIKHDFDLRGGTGWGWLFDDKHDAKWIPPIQFASGFSSPIHVSWIKRHPLSHIYKEGFWEYTKQTAVVIQQTLPSMLDLSFSGGSAGSWDELLPGEEVLIECFGQIDLFLGPQVGITGWAPQDHVGIGPYANLGVRAGFTHKHHKIRLKKLRGSLVQVVLEASSNKSWGLSSAVGLSGKYHFVSSGQELAQASSSHTHTTTRLVDLTFDISGKYPLAIEHLLKAMRGSFSDSQALAEMGIQGQFAGVTRNVISKDKRDTLDHRFKVLSFERKSGFTRGDTEVRAFDDSDQPEAPTYRHYDRTEVVHHSRKEGHHLEASVITDLANPNLNSSRSLTVHTTYRDQQVDADERQEVLDVLADLIPESDRPGLFESGLAPGGPALRSLEVDLMVDFGPDSIRHFLDHKSRLTLRLYMAWAKILGLDQPKEWASLTEEQREQRARLSGMRVLKHFRKIHNFQKKVRQILEDTNFERQGFQFVGALPKMQWDLYPLAALIDVAKVSHQMTYEIRLTYRLKKQAPKTFHFTFRPS